MRVRPVVAVTGASRGIGAATAARLGETGAAVTLVARSADPLSATAEAVERAGGEATVLGMAGWMQAGR